MRKVKEESKAREADLKKAREAGKTSLRTPEEIKAKLEERNAIIEEVVKTAKEHGVNNWRGIIEVGERYNIFAKGLVASQVKTYIVDFPKKCEELKEALIHDQEIAPEDMPE